MNREEIIKLARESGLFVPHEGIPENGAFMRFAALVAAAEREACAELLDANAAVCQNNSMLADVLAANAAAIRARGN